MGLLDDCQQLYKRLAKGRHDVSLVLTYAIRECRNGVVGVLAQHILEDKGYCAR
jgi:hypothetical protein